MFYGMFFFVVRQCMVQYEDCENIGTIVIQECPLNTRIFFSKVAYFGYDMPSEMF
jgi:hypothetical protein